MNNYEYEAIFTNASAARPATRPCWRSTTSGGHAAHTAAITFGQTLGSATLGGGTSSVLGTWSYVDPSTVLGAGTNTNVPVIFTPNDLTTYDVVPSTVTQQADAVRPHSQACYARSRRSQRLRSAAALRCAAAP